MITIIGAGLCGLATAYRLHKSSVPFTILESNALIGGRIQAAGEHAKHQDLGPSWVWPYAQPVVEEWLDELGIKTFEQYDSGDGLMDMDLSNQAQRQMMPGQHGIARVEGGTHAFIKALMNKLPDAPNTNCVVTSISSSNNTTQSITNSKVNIEYSCNGKDENVETDVVILATPPRLAASLLPTDDKELGGIMSLLHRTPTWMAPHAKVVIHYESAFWREMGLSGRIASQVGPLAEVHDHSGPDGMPAALFGFAGVPAEHRKDTQALTAAIEQQLARCFGNDAPKPTNITIKDWAFEPYTSTAADLTGPMMHPSVMDGSVREGHWNNTLFIAGAETSRFSPGLIEGALARADEVSDQVLNTGLLAY